MKKRNFIANILNVKLKAIFLVFICLILFSIKVQSGPIIVDSTTAFIIIDIQNDYFPGGKCELSGSPEACTIVKKVLTKLRNEKSKIVHVLHKNAGTYFVPGTEGQKIHSDLTPLPGEKVIEKTAPSSFSETGLDDFLKEQKIKKVILCGMQTNVCVEATTNAANSLGYKTFVMEDGCAAIEGSIHAQTIKRLGKTATLINSFDILNNVYKGPESVVCNYITGDYYVSNSQGGTISKLPASGIPEVFVSGLSFPLGLTILDNTLYVADSARIKGFAIKSGDKTFEISVNGAARLNGITSDGDSILYATDDTNDKVFKINAIDKTVKVILDKFIDFPNGIEFDNVNKRILICESGPRPFISAINLADYSLDTLSNANYGALDGLTFDMKGNIYFSSWGKSGVLKYPHDFSSGPVQLTFNNSGPADIFYNTKDSILVVPNMTGGFIDFISYADNAGVLDTFSADTRLFYHSENLSVYSITDPIFSVSNKLGNYGSITDSINIILPDTLATGALTVNYSKLQIAPSTSKTLSFTINPSKFALGKNKLEIKINSKYSLTKQVIYTIKFEIKVQTSLIDKYFENQSINVFPNPFSSYINFNYNLTENGNVKLDIYNLKGQLVKKLVSCKQLAGNQKIGWNGIDQNGNSISSGIYIFVLECNGKKKTGEFVFKKQNRY